jgi:lactate dehydrogenase-like 2-hydroxyacid dehydrogenase
MPRELEPETVLMTKPVLLSTGFMMPLMVEQLEAAFECHWMERVADKQKLIDEIGPRVVAGCTGSHTGVRMDAAMLSKLPNLKVIGNFGVGYDTIDIPEAARRGVVITNTPDVLNEEVADTALGLLIMTVRELSKAETYMRAGEWAAKGDYPLTPASLRTRRVGMVGYGRIGKCIGRRLDAFGVPYVYFGRKPQAGVTQRFYDNLVEMARDVNTLLLILPGGPATQNLVNMEVLKALGPDGIVINMARGSVVDEKALMQALRDRVILSAGLDVFVNEPKVDPAWLTTPHLTLLPHVGSASQHTRNAMGQLTVDNLLAFKAGKPPLTPVLETPFKGW